MKLYKYTQAFVSHTVSFIHLLLLSCQVTVGEGTVHPGQVDSSSEGCYVFGLWEEAVPEGTHADTERT